MDELFDAIAVALVIAVGAATFVVLVRKHPIAERRLLGGALVMHFLFALALRYTQGRVYGEGDLGIYLEASDPLVDLLRRDVVRWVPQLVYVTLHLPSDLPFEEFSPTLSMVTTMAMARYVTLDSIWALYVILGFFSFLGKWGLYAAFRDELGTENRRWIAYATLYVPSVVFWTSGFVKEAFAIIGLGALFYGTRLLLTLGRKGLPYLLIGTLLISIYKPYILFPFASGAGVWFFFERSKRARQSAPLYLIIGGLVGYLLIVLLSAVFPQFSPTQIAEQTAQMQLHGEVAGGGSYYGIGDAGARTIGGQLAYAPLALVTTLARPGIWEVHNVTSALASLEMTVLTILLFRAILLGGLGSVRATFTAPVNLFALFFIVFGAIAIGLATTNFGTLSRYRVPIIPFYALLVFMMNAHASTQALLARRRAAPVSGSPHRLPQRIAVSSVRGVPSSDSRDFREG